MWADLLDDSGVTGGARDASLDGSGDEMAVLAPAGEEPRRGLVRFPVQPERLDGSIREQRVAILGPFAPSHAQEPALPVHILRAQPNEFALGIGTPAPALTTPSIRACPETTAPGAHETRTRVGWRPHAKVLPNAASRRRSAPTAVIRGEYRTETPRQPHFRTACDPRPGRVTFTSASSRGMSCNVRGLRTGPALYCSGLQSKWPRSVPARTVYQFKGRLGRSAVRRGAGSLLLEEGAARNGRTIICQVADQVTQRRSPDARAA